MNKTNFKKYIAYVKQKRKSNIEDEYIEKDYVISQFFSAWQKQKEKITKINNLIFKGGTLLSRNFLDYPRISEDIDFTYEHSQRLRRISSNSRREKEIKKIVIPLIREVKSICNILDFDFETNRKNKKYINLLNSRAVYIFYVYYKSKISGSYNPLKIEVNFLEKRLFDYKKLKIQNIVENNTYLDSIGYKLSNAYLKTYSLDEIILEKYRAILTRQNLKERDVFDLYLIHKNSKNVLQTKNHLISDKIKSSYLISPSAKRNTEHNCNLLEKNNFGSSDDNLSSLTLKEINYDEYNSFKKSLFKKMKNICQLNLS